MKKNMHQQSNPKTKPIFLLLALLICNVTLHAQSWQWLKTGGNVESGPDFDFSEEIRLMDSDPAGNVYVAMKQVIEEDVVETQPFYIGGYAVPHYSNRDYILASFACDGTLRWTVALGGGFIYDPILNFVTTSHYPLIKKLEVDAQGNVYITGKISRIGDPSIPFHFDPTFTVPNAVASNVHKEKFFVAKYNSSGQTQWVRFPESPNVDTNLIAGTALSFNMAVDPNGTVHIDAIFAPGIFCNGALTITGEPTSITRRVLKYDTNGNYIGNVALDLTDRISDTTTFKHDPILDRYYILKNITSTSTATSIGGQLQTKALFLAAFANNGVLLWKKEDDNTNLSGSWSPNRMGLSIDENNNLYLSKEFGSVSNEQLQIIRLNQWDGQVIPVPASFNEYSVYSLFIKMNSNGDTVWMKTSTFDERPLLTKNTISGDELVVAINYNKFAMDGIPFEQAPELNLLLPGLVRINKDTGVGISLENLNVNIYHPYGVTSIATGPNGSVYIAGGFGNTISTAASGAPVYTKGGGVDDFFIAKFGTNNCTLATTTVNEAATIKAYPNPVVSLLHLDNKEAVSYIIYDAQGKMVLMDTLAPNGSIDLNYLTKGIYLLHMKDENGASTTQKIVKE